MSYYEILGLFLLLTSFSFDLHYYISMELEKLISNIDILQKVNFNAKIIVNSLEMNSAKCGKNSLFFAINGTNTSGEIYADIAVKNGANVVVTEHKLKNLNVCQLIVDNTRCAMAKISANFYENAHKKLKIISIVGTNGKTSTAHILGSILSCAGKKVGIIGTNGCFICGKKIKNDMTTPDPIELHKLFFDMASFGVEYVVMEASAHAIKLHKLDGIISQCAIFTNFSQDHLDFFCAMDNYKQTKLSFFTPKFTQCCIANIDDLVGQELVKTTALPCITYGIKNPSDIFAVNISMNLKGSEFVVNAFDDVYKIKTNLTCLFNVYNILSCIACANFLGITKSVIKKALQNITQIAGRFNLIDLKQNFNIVIDYAHTPESLKVLLENIKVLTKSKVITVFGCPGNRDELKREIMGEIAGNFSDFCVITSDNPQFENSYRIMRQIERGIYKTNCPYRLVDDREEAISLAISLAQPKYTVLIVGKGEEDYQNINGEHIPYNDKNAIEKQLMLAKKLKLENKFLY